MPLMTPIEWVSMIVFIIAFAGVLWIGKQNKKKSGCTEKDC